MLEFVLAIILIPLAILAVMFVITILEAFGLIGKGIKYGGRVIKAATEDLEAKAKIRKKQADRKEKDYVEVTYEDTNPK